MLDVYVHTSTVLHRVSNLLGMYTKIINAIYLVFTLHARSSLEIVEEFGKKVIPSTKYSERCENCIHMAPNNIGKMPQYTFLIVKYVNKLNAES